MIWPPPASPRTYTLFPSTTLFRANSGLIEIARLFRRKARSQQQDQRARHGEEPLDRDGQQAAVNQEAEQDPAAEADEPTHQDLPRASVARQQIGRAHV